MSDHATAGTTLHDLPRGRILLGLGVIFLVALSLRAGAVYYLQAWQEPGFMEHHQLAENMVLGNGFAFRDWSVFEPSSVQSPTYPVFLAGLYTAFGIGSDTAFTAALLVNALLGALAAALVYPMVRSAGGSAMVGLVAAGATAVWPTQIYAVTHVQAVAMIIAGVVAATWLWNRATVTGGTWSFFAFAVVGCFTALTEPVLLPVMFFAGVALLFYRRLPFPIRVRNGFILLLTTAAIVGPWVWRNYEVQGRFVPGKNTFWVNVWKGNNPHATGTDRVAYSQAEQAMLASMPDAQRRDLDSRRQYDMLPPEAVARLTGKTDDQRQEIFGEWAKAWISQNPGEYAALCANRLVMSIWIDPNNPKGWDLRYVLPRTLLLVLTPIGLFIAWRRGWRLFFPALAFGLSLLTVTLTITAARFALPFEPYQLALCTLAGVALLRVVVPARAPGERGMTAEAAKPQM